MVLGEKSFCEKVVFDATHPGTGTWKCLDRVHKCSEHPWKSSDHFEYGQVMSENPDYNVSCL